MGHIITGLGQYFASFNATFSTKKIGVLKSKPLGERALIRADIVTEWRILKDVESRKCYLLCQYTLKHMNKSSSKSDEESEGSSNESWLKKKALENEAAIEQMIFLCLDILDSKLYARLDELQIMMENFCKSQENHFKRLKKLIEAKNTSNSSSSLIE